MESVVKLIRKYRSAVMGAAILWVVLYHTDVHTSLPGIPRFLLETGYGGVDIFLFLSGFGLYSSLERDPDVLRFFKRRAWKIFPSYLPILLVWMLALPERNCGFLYWLRLTVGNATGAAFWLKIKSFNWYILALPTFYLAAPLLKSVMDSGGKGRAYLLMGGALCLSTAFLDDWLLIAASRFPIFVMGMYLARVARSGEDTYRMERAAYWLMALGVGILYFCLRYARDTLWTYGLWWYPFLLVAPGLTMLLCRAAAALEKTKAGTGLVRILAVLGRASLEIYLIHVPVLEFLNERMHLENAWRLLVAAALILAGVIYHQAVAAGVKAVQKKAACIHSKTNP